MTLFRRFALAFGLLIAAIASQLPEFAQQYRQRLGGALDELTKIVGDFDAQAANLGLGRNDAVARLEANPDELAKQRGESVEQTIARRGQLAQEDEAFAKAGPVGRLAVLARDFDPQIARRAWSAYEPALPVTAEGLLCAAAGLIAGLALWHGAALPIRMARRRRNSEPRRA